MSRSARAHRFRGAAPVLPRPTGYEATRPAGWDDHEYLLKPAGWLPLSDRDRLELGEIAGWFPLLG